jgi:WD40 repeat protein
MGNFPLLAKDSAVALHRPILEHLIEAALEDSQSLLTPLLPLQHLPGGPLFLTMKGHRDAISAIATTSLMNKQTGQTSLCIVSSSWDKTLKSWDLNTTGVLKTFDGHTDKVLTVVLATDGQYMSSGCVDMTIR